MAKEQFVEFETAKLLKERGFDGLCYKVWHVADGSKSLVAAPFFVEGETVVNKDTVDAAAEQMVYPYSMNNKVEGFLVPTQAMAMRWLREKHNIHIELTPICTGDSDEDLEWHYGWAVKTTIFTDRWKRHNAEHISYEEACEAAIKYCLKNLI